jgi:hypothetical protein
MFMRSEGLLQLSYTDQKRYGYDFNWQVNRVLNANDPAKTILQPKGNLEWGSGDPGQADHRPTQTFADSVRILVDFAAGRAELPCIRQADDKSPGRLRSPHQVGDRQVGCYEVRAGRREPPSNSQIV